MQGQTQAEALRGKDRNAEADAAGPSGTADLRGAGPISADITYIARFFVTQCPTTLGYVGRMRGLSAPRPTDSFTYCDLGCGAGLTVNVLAAAMPQARFYGIDMSADHIAIAQRMAEAGDLANTTFITSTFDELLGRTDLPQFDFLALHGIYSWVGRETRQDLLRLTQRLLKPGGLLYVNYNALPGWAPLLPVRESLLLLAQQADGNPTEKALSAFQQMNRIAERSPFFQNNPATLAMLRDVQADRQDYVIHEFLSAAWDLFTFDDVAREMASVGLEYCGSTLLEPNAGDSTLAPELRAPVRAIDDPIAAESLRSFLRGERYRADVFSSAAPDADWLGKWEDFSDQVFGPPAGPVPLPNIRGGELADQVSAFFEATERGRLTLGEIAELPPFAGETTETLLRVAHAAARSHARRPYARRALDDIPTPERIGAALPIVHALLPLATAEGRAPLPSQILGTGVILPFPAAMLLQAAFDSGIAGALEIAVDRIAASRKNWVHKGRRLETPGEIRAAMRPLYRECTDEWLPFLLRTGIVEPA
jgi:trans-aconitate methyltransferase